MAMGGGAVQVAALAPNRRDCFVSNLLSLIARDQTVTHPKSHNRPSNKPIVSYVAATAASAVKAESARRSSAGLNGLSRINT